MTPWVTRLLIANAVVFLLTSLNEDLKSVFAFVPVLVLSRPWTLVTYMFIHFDFWHIFFNMLGLFFFGPKLEIELGATRFLLLYFISGLSGAVFSFILPFTPIIGASAAVYGVLIGYAHFWPRDQVLIWGIIPVEARWFVLGLTALSLWGGFGGGGGNIAHFAHLGGFAGGYIFIRVAEYTSRGARFQRAMRTPPPRTEDIERWKHIRRDSMHEINREEYDRIMAKLAASGVAGLTETERLFLDRFSSDT